MATASGSASPQASPGAGAEEVALEEPRLSDHRCHDPRRRRWLQLPSFATDLKILGDIFLRRLKTAVAPLVFLCVTIGIVSAGDFKRVGKVGLVAMLYFEIVSTLALTFGLLAGNLLGIGKGIAAATTAAACMKPPTGQPHSTMDFILKRLSGQLLRGLRQR